MANSNNRKNRKTLPRLQFGQFSEDELARIQENLKQRFKHIDIRQIGFGQAEIDGKPDSKRPFSVCFFVANKRMPRDKKMRIPPTVKIWLVKGNKRKSYELPTDVIKSRKMKTTGRQVRRIHQSKRVTTGIYDFLEKDGQ